ncbi:MAG TPA: hypothetical protein VH008_00810 [Pseudonocardia sp.]|jgi:hypothetical protein|nr:hypothetical protein [Pseudonocardia sp.]
MVGLFVWLLRLSRWPGTRLPFGAASAARRDETALRPHADGDRPASFTDLALGGLARDAALLCLALLIAARLGARHAWRCDRPGFAPARSQDAPRGPPSR